MIVERLQAVLEASGLAAFAAQMAAADKATGGVKDQLAQVTAVSKTANAALRNVRMDSAQAAQTQALADQMARAVKTVGTTAVLTSSQMGDVRLTGAQTTQTVANAATMAAAIRGVDSAAAGARRSIEGLGAVSGASGVARAGSATAGFTTADLRNAGFGGGTAGTLALLGKNGDPGLANTLRLLGWENGGSGSSTVSGGGLATLAALRMASSGGGGGGGGIGPLLAAAAAGGGKGGGGGILSALGFGQGMFGMAGFGSVAGLAGFGAERAVTSGLGIAGSLGGGLIGGGLLGLGALGTTAVGMGTDLAGIGQAAGDIKNTTQALDNLQKQIQIYGKNSQQAAVAQQQVNQTLQSFSPVARQAVLAASQTAVGFHAMFNTMTGEAESTGAKIIQQAMLVGEKFLPTIGMFASQNMGIIQKGLQPLFSWLQQSGSQGGLGIFTNLEQIFQSNLPTSIHAFSQALEVLFKVIDDSAQHLGGFIAYVDKLFTKLNSPQMAGPMAAEISKLIGLFETWLHLFGAVGGALFDLLKPAVGFGQQLAAGLTVLLDKTRQWLSAAGTKDVLHAVFQAHLDQLKGIFAVLQSIGPALGAAIKAFLSIEATISEVVAVGLKLVADVIKPIMSIPMAAQIAGWAAALLITKKAVEGVIASGQILRVLLLGLGPAAATGAATADASVASIGETAVASTGAVAGLRAALLSLAGPAALAVAAGGIGYTLYKAFSSKQPTRVAPGPSGLGTNIVESNGRYYIQAGPHLTPYTGPIPGRGTANAGVLTTPNLPHGVGSTGATGAGNFGMAPVLGVAQQAAAFAAHANALNAAGYGGAPFSVPGVPAVTPGGGGGGAATGIPAIGNAATTLGQLATHYQTLAQTLNNTGVKAKQYLVDEQKALQKELAALPAASGKNAAAITAAAATIRDNLIKVGVQIKDALDKTGAALIPANLRATMASQLAQFQADTAYQQALTGQTASDYGTTLLNDLTTQRTTLTSEIAKLKASLAGKTAQQKSNITAEIGKLQTQMTTLNQSIISQLESNINALQTSLGNIFNSVQSELDTQLGNLYYQNGLLTPSEALLQSMQSADQLNGLNQSLAQAQATLANDQSSLAKRVLDVATGKITNVYDPQNAAQIATDTQAVSAAQRALDEYNLQIKATQERTTADNTYTAQVAKLNAQLATWEQNAMNGTATMGQLRDIAASFGLQINTQTVPDFANLGDVTGKLAAAFAELIAYIEKLTGKTPQNQTTGGGGGGPNSVPVGSGYYSPTGVSLIPRPGQPIYQAFGGLKMAAAGLVAMGPMFNHRSNTIFGEAGAEAYLPLDNPKAVSKIRAALGTNGGGDTYHVTVNVAGSVQSEKNLADTIRRELIRTNRRNGNSTTNLVGS